VDLLSFFKTQARFKEGILMLEETSTFSPKLSLQEWWPNYRERALPPKSGWRKERKGRWITRL